MAIFVLLIVFCPSAFCTSKLKISEKDREGIIRSPVSQFIMDNDKDVMKVITKDEMSCIFECFRTPGCKFFNLIVKPGIGVRAKQCSMDIGEGPRSFYPEADECTPIRILNAYISRYPSAVAGVCSDHRCARKTVCTPTTPGQYTCELDKTAKREKRKRERQQAREKRKKRREERLAAERKRKSETVKID